MQRRLSAIGFELSAFCIHTRAMHGARGLAAVLLLSALSYSGVANAYCRSMTIKDKGRLPTLPQDSQPGFCPGSGVALFWRTRCVGYSVSRAASKFVSLDETSRIAAAAFAKWTQVACASDDPVNSRVSIDIRDLGPSDCTAEGFNKTGPNQNLIIFRDDNWAHDKGASTTIGGSDTIALTTVSYETSSGEIFDADIEINSHDHTISADSTFQNDTEYDLPSIITHEAGHFLGLDHSAVRSSSMFFQYDVKETTKQFLKNDDIQGICSIYKPDGTRATGSDGSVPLPAGACDPTPRRGLDNVCAATTCSLSRAFLSSGNGGAANARAMGVVGLGVLAIIRRRRRAVA